MKTVIFLRGAKTAQQKKVCEEYAKANDLEIVAIIDDEKELTAFVLGGNVENVLVSHASRISRNRIEYIESEKMFNRFGVELIAAEGAAQ